MELIATYLFPLYLLLLIKTVRRPRAATAVLCGLTLGPSLLVQPLFIPFLLVPSTAAWLLCEVCLLKRKMGRQGWLALAGALALGLIIAAPFFWPVLRQQVSGQGAYLEGIGTVSFSADLLGIVAPSPANPVLGALGMVPSYAHRVAPDDWRIAELLTYAGFVPLGLGLLAALGPRASELRCQAAAWALVAVLAAVLSLGPVLKVNGEVVSFSVDDVKGPVEITVALPYALLTNLPLLSLNRAPARIHVTLMLALAVLAAYGLAWLMARLRRRWRGVAATALCLVTLAEFLVVWPCPTTPVRPPAYLADIAESGNQGAVLNLPIAAGHVKQVGLFYQTIHERPLFDSWFQRSLPVSPDVAGFLDGLLLPAVGPDIVPAPSASDRAAVARAEGVGHVLLHTLHVGHVEAEMQLLEAAFGPPRSVEEEMAIYEVPPGPAVPTDLVYALPNNDGRSLEQGWQYVEDWNGLPARWMPESAHLVLYSPRQQQGALQFTALPLAAPQRLEIEVDGVLLSPLVVGEWMTYTTLVFTLQQGINQIALYARGGCTRIVGDPRCGGVALAAAGGESLGCSPALESERCLGVLFQAFRFVEAAAAPAGFPLDVVLGEQVRLVGYDVAGTAEPGHILSLTLYWQALRSMDEDYTLFVHLLGEDGRLLAQHDAPPLGGVYPTSQWVPGDLFTQRVDLSLPPEAPPGTAALLAGMYTYPDIVRLPVAGDRPYARDGLVWLQDLAIR
ncbi:MAG: hypothetical protein JXD18_13440 [Anaerolineae bacterium]|nr:hypothetical protein [Anaerolineae bacterium]